MSMVAMRRGLLLVGLPWAGVPKNILEPQVGYQPRLPEVVLVVALVVVVLEVLEVVLVVVAVVVVMFLLRASFVLSESL